MHPDPTDENGLPLWPGPGLHFDNFAIGGRPLPPAFNQALGLIKACAARVNGRLGVLPTDLADAIEAAAQRVAAGELDDQFLSISSRPAPARRPT